MRAATCGAVLLASLATAPAASAEPKFLAKQYTRCGACHINPAGGGLLSAYGRSLSHRELSTTGDRSGNPPDPAAGSGEEAFLWGALGRRLGPLALGIELRPSHLQYSSGGVSVGRNLLMAANVHGALQANDWIAYAQLGREPTATGARVVSYEHWVGRQPERGVGFRVGRFLPAYGVRFADHTSYNRSLLGLAQRDQVYGVEVSHSSERVLSQVSIGPGRAESLLDDDGSEALLATARVQVDVGARTAVAISARHDADSDVTASRTAAGAAIGHAPTAWWTTWTQVDRQSSRGRASYQLTHETAIEAYRGVWVTVSPQLRLGTGDARNDLRRLAIGTVLLPRTHVNVNLTYYRDWSEVSDTTRHIVLSQLHVYF